MLRAKAMAIVVYYDMYLEASEGRLYLEWRVANPMRYHEFHKKRIKLMVDYHPIKKMYP